MKYHMQFSNNQNSISEIKTDRITLATPNINKASIILDAVRASSEDIYPWLPWAKQDIALKDIKNYIKHFMDCNTKANPSNLFFDIWDNESDKYLGNIYFGQIEWRAPAFSIGYWIDSRESNKGYMTEAVNALAHVAFRHFKAKRIEISTSDENFSAKRIPEKLNFDLEAEFINHHKNYATNKISNTLVYSCVDENRLPKLKSLSWKSALPSIYKLKQIETPRLLIRPVQLGDEYPLNKAVNNSLELLQKWQPWAKDPSIEATRGFVQRGVFAWESGSVVDFPMVVIHKEDNKIIAASGYNDRSDVAHALYEIGYWCDVDYQGKGYVTEYANALTRYAFDALGAAKVVISMQIENEKSIAVAKRLNFINEGVKERDPLDCVSDKAEENYIYAVNNTENLPDLKYSWTDIEGDLSVPKIISWAKNTLKITDDKAFASSKAIVKTPWSNVLEINTGDEIVYFKQTPIDLFLEAEIIKLLCASGIKTTPQIIDDNKNEHCFLMTKCGDITLRDYFDGNLQIDVLKQAIVSYKKLQRSTVKCVDELLAIGVPDWRLDKFPGLYDELIGDTEYLDDNNVTIEQQKQLHQYKDRVKNLCAELATFGIAETLNHSDFHDNNILYNRTNKTTAIIDLGETAINHPLFSLHACIEAAKNKYHLTEDSADYKLLQQFAFDGFLDDKQKFNRAIEIITLLFPVYLLFAQKRFLDAIHMPFDANDPLSVKQHEKINKGFVWFIKNMEVDNAK